MSDASILRQTHQVAVAGNLQEDFAFAKTCCCSDVTLVFIKPANYEMKLEHLTNMSSVVRLSIYRCVDFVFLYQFRSCRVVLIGRR